MGPGNSPGEQSSTCWLGTPVGINLIAPSYKHMAARTMQQKRWTTSWYQQLNPAGNAFLLSTFPCSKQVTWLHSNSRGGEGLPYYTPGSEVNWIQCKAPSPLILLSQLTNFPVVSRIRFLMYISSYK